MTKTQIHKWYEFSKDKIVGIILYIHMPTGETELIYNPNVVDKLNYIDKAYNEYLVLNTCSDIWIEKVQLVSNEQIMISKDEYICLGEESRFLNALEITGVENWEGYDMAKDTLKKWDEEN